VSSNNFTGGKIMVPGGLGLNYNVLIHSYDFGLTKECSMLITPGSNGTVEFGPDEHLIGPPMDTTGVNNNTQFYYSSNVPGAIYTIEFYDEIYGYRVEINTTAANVKLPDLSIFGKYLPSNQRIHWQVTRRTGYNGINDLASWTVCKNPVNSILYNYSENRSFTTAPR
jgi:hypothetical protein